jgi:hypothetical protein
MNIHTNDLIVLESLFSTVLVLVFGIYFLIISEILREKEIFGKIKRIIFSFLLSSLMITGPILLFLCATYPKDLSLTPDLILDNSTFPVFLVGSIVDFLIFLVATSVILEGKNIDSCHHKTNCEISKDNMKIAN